MTATIVRGIDKALCRYFEIESMEERIEFYKYVVIFSLIGIMFCGWFMYDTVRDYENFLKALGL